MSNSVISSFGDHRGRDAERGEAGVDLGLGVAAIRRHGRGRSAAERLDSLDGRGQQWRIGNGTDVHAVVEDDAVDVVDHLSFVTELDRLAEPALLGRPGVGVVEGHQPGGRGGHAAGQAFVGLGEHSGAPSDRRLEIGHRPGRLALRRRAGPRRTSSGVLEHGTRLSQGLLGQVGQFAGDASHRHLGLVVAELQVGRDGPGTPACSPAGVAHGGPGGEPKGVDQGHQGGEQADELDQQSRVRRPADVGLHHPASSAPRHISGERSASG